MVIDLLEGLHRLLGEASTEDRGWEEIPGVNHTVGEGPKDIVPRLRWDSLGQLERMVVRNCVLAMWR